MLRLGGRGKVGKEQYLTMLRLGGRGKVGKEQYLTMLHYHHQNEFCVTMASNESHVNVPIIMRGSQQTASKIAAFEEKRDAKQGNRTDAVHFPALPLGQTGSPRTSKEKLTCNGERRPL